MVNNGKVPCRILHTSDLHLATLGDKACHSLVALVDVAIRTKVDLVIIAGDLFDYNRVDDDLVSFVVEQLRRLSVYVVILPGNHDCLVPDSVYHKVKLWNDATNVRIFREVQGETLALPGLGVSVWGRAIASYDGNLRPLAGIPRPQENGQWHIAVGHGYYVENDADSFRAHLISQQEIVTSGWDYIALGHIPVFAFVGNESVKAYYCDSPSLSGKVLIVDLIEETGVQVSRYSIWESQEGIA